MKSARYREIHHQLREQILAGVYKSGDRLPTEMELAAELGVSRVTSVAALAELAREGLVHRTPRRGTVVSASAVPARTSRRPLVAWIQPDVDHGLGINLLRGIEYAAHIAGYSLLLHLTGTSRQDEEDAIRGAVADGAAGLALFLQDGETYNGEVLRLALEKFPLVLVDRYLRGLDCATVQSDNVAGARELTAELIRAGHRRICTVVFSPKDTSTIEDRVEGYSQALAAAGIPFDRSLLYIEDRLREVSPIWQIPGDIVERFATYLRRKPDVSAVFATNAALALLTLRAAERRGLCVPDDLSIVGIDAVQTFPLTLPTLTCALQQGFEIGTTAFELLQEQIQGQVPRRVMLPMTIARNGSIAPPRGTHNGHPSYEASSGGRYVRAIDAPTV